MVINSLMLHSIYVYFIYNMETKIPEIEARNILSTYEGSNNQLLDWKRKFVEVKNFKLTRPQSEYVMKYKDVTPKVAKKYINIVSTFGEKIMEERLLPVPPEKIWCEKLLCDSDKAFHIWGKVIESDQLSAMWLPKAAVVQEEKKLDRIIDYSKYSSRPPMDHQKIAIEKLLANNKFILADDMGLGKTTSAVIASLESKARKILIVCPASLKINWEREIRNYSDRKVLIVEGRKWGSTFDFYIINYDIIKNYHTTDKSEDSDDYKLLVNANFDLAIVDEAHYISNATANRTRLLNDVLDTIPKVWLLTGTPMTSRPINYFNLLKIVESPLALNWQSYVRRYCKGYQFNVGNRKVWNTSGASNLDELRERTKNLVLRRMKTDILDLPEKIVTPVFVELSSKMYDEELEEFTRISNDKKNDETITVTLNRLMKIRQLIAYEKIPYTCEIIDKCLEQGKKVIVLTNFTMSLDMLHEKYKKNSVTLDGRMNKDRRQENVDRFQNDDKIKVFIGNIKAAGVGITLTAAEVVIMNDLSFVPADHSQGEDRAYRYGQKNSVLVYYPVFENTVEKIIYNILQKKKGVIDQVMGDGEYSESFSKDLLKSLL
jgi:SNF2 family DNA or RNA helicase